LKKSEKRTEKVDPDYVHEPVSENENPLKLIIKPYNFKEDQVYLVYESQLEKLFKFCKCGQPIIEIIKVNGEGTQQTFKFSCLAGCAMSWCTQPILPNIKGAGNLTVTAATDIAGLSFFSKIKTVFSTLKFENGW